MSENGGFAAELLKRSAAGYAGAAAPLLLEAEPALKQQAGALGVWKSHLTQRVVELAAALAVNQPQLFNERVRWSRKTFAARDQDEKILRLSLSCLRDVLQDSLPSQAKLAVDYVNQALQALEEPAPVEDSCELDPKQPTGKLALAYLQLILEGESAAAAEKVLEAVKEGMSVQEAVLDVLLPAQKEIGRLWHLNEVSVAEEHLVSGCTKRTLSLLAYVSDRAAKNNATVIAACVPGNIHDIGLRALSDLFYIEGWRAEFLGADVPVNDLASVIATLDADLLLLGGTMSTQIEAARNAIASVRKQNGDKVKIMLGGAVFDEAPGLWQELGADAYAANGREAIIKAAELIDITGG